MARAHDPSIPRAYAIVQQCHFDPKLTKSLNKLLNAIESDEAGHLLAPTLGGLCNAPNFFPKARSINQNTGTGYLNEGAGWLVF